MEDDLTKAIHVPVETGEPGQLLRAGIAAIVQQQKDQVGAERNGAWATLLRARADQAHAKGYWKVVQALRELAREGA